MHLQNLNQGLDGLTNNCCGQIYLSPTSFMLSLILNPTWLLIIKYALIVPVNWDVFAVL